MGKNYTVIPNLVLDSDRELFRDLFDNAMLKQVQHDNIVFCLLSWISAFAGMTRKDNVIRFTA